MYDKETVLYGYFGNILGKVGSRFLCMFTLPTAPIYSQSCLSVIRELMEKICRTTMLSCVKIWVQVLMWVFIFQCIIPRTQLVLGCRHTSDICENKACLVSWFITSRSRSTTEWDYRKIKGLLLKWKLFVNGAANFALTSLSFAVL